MEQRTPERVTPAEAEAWEKRMSEAGITVMKPDTATFTLLTDGSGAVD